MEVSNTYLEPNINYMSNLEAQNSQLQLLWLKHMTEPYNPSYSHVSVIMISWHDNIDDLKVKSEVDQLGKLLRDVYKYKVVHKELTEHPKTLPQNQFNKYLSNFVADEDDDDTLLIIYYAGHGAPNEDGSLGLAGKREPGKNSSRDGVVIWNWAEHLIRSTKADVFVIFDCCYAGILGRDHRSISRSSEFLSANAAGLKTRGPGDNSFTTALIWALRELATSNISFTTSQLVKKIIEAPGLPEDQYPQLVERGANSGRRIVLSPLEEQTPSTNTSSTSTAGENLSQTGQLYLDLRFVFDKVPEERDLRNLASGLKQMIQQDELPRRPVIWNGLKTANPVHDTVMEVIKRLKERRTGQKSLPNNSPIENRTLTPTIRKRKQNQRLKGNTKRKNI